MSKKHTIGLVTPQAVDRVPAEGAQMYPDVNFIPKGVGVRALTPEGYDGAWNGIIPAAEELAGREGVEAIMVAGTSLTFIAAQKRTRECWKKSGHSPASRPAP